MLVLRAARGRVRDGDPRLVPDGDPHARRAVLRDAQHAGRRRAARAPRGARLAQRGPDARAEQPGHRGGTRHRHPAAAGRRHAAQAGPARRRPDRPGQAAPARRAAGAGHRAGGQGAEAHRHTGQRRRVDVGDWLEEHQVTGGWDLAPVFVQAGLDIQCLEEIAGSVGPGLLDQSLHWLGYALETEQLMTDIEDASARISSLVGAAKQYSQLDRASHQWIDVHAGIDSTLVMLNHKIGDGVRVVKEYDRTLPKIPAHPAELNQVWTNLVDNAVQAMQGSGTLTIRTARDGGRILVEVADTGPGVPPDLRRRVFEPFFTTKPVGQGTGLGLDISYRIVVNRHRGDLTLTSEPGDTRFQVRLPLTEPASN